MRTTQTTLNNPNCASSRPFWRRAMIVLLIHVVCSCAAFAQSVTNQPSQYQNPAQAFSEALKSGDEQAQQAAWNNLTYEQQVAWRDHWKWTAEQNIRMIEARRSGGNPYLD